MKKACPKRSRRVYPECSRRGVTLIEMIVVIAILGVASSIVYTIFTQSQKTYNIEQNQTALQMDIRASVDEITRRVKQASSSASIFANPAPATTGYVDLSGDNALSWQTAVPSGAHYTTLDDGTRQPAVPNTTDYITDMGPPSRNDDFNVDMSTLAADSVNSVKLWAYAKNEAPVPLNVNIYIAGAWQTADTSNTLTSSYAWYSATWTGTWTQADLDALRIRVMKTGGGTITETVAAIYAEVTYTSNIAGYGQTPFNYTAVTGTASDVLIIKIMSEDTSGNIIPNSYDYYIYKRSGTSPSVLQEILIANSASARKSKTKTLMQKVSAFSVTYFNSQGNPITSSFENASMVKVKLDGQDITAGKTTNSSFTSASRLRNF